MVKINGKEYTDEQLNNILKDLDTAQTALKQKNEQLKEKEGLEQKVQEAEKLRSENEKLKTEFLKKRYEDRAKLLSKYLASKDDERRKSLMSKVYDMDDDEFDDFKEGKTDEEIITKDTLTSEKQALESKESELEKKKKEIIEEAMKNMQKDEKDNELLSRSAIDSDIKSEKDETRLGDGKFPNIETLKDIYYLDRNPMYKNKFTKFHEERAEAYLDTNYERDSI